MQASSIRAHWLLAAAFAALSALGCDDGGGDSGTPGGAGGGGGSGGGSMSMGLPLTSFEGDDGLGSGYFVSADYGYEAAFFTYNDGTTTGTQTPAAMTDFTVAPGGHTGSFAANTTGSGFTTWGSGMGFNIRVPAGAGSPLDASQQCVGTAPCTFDASMFTGVSFWAKLGPSAAHAVRFKVVDAQSAEAANGGTCSLASECGDNFGAPLALSADWQYFEFKWADLKQEGWGTTKFTAVQTDKFLGLQWQAPASVAFDYWVDDVSFTTN